MHLWKFSPFKIKQVKKNQKIQETAKVEKKVKKEDINNYKQFVAELLAEVRNSLLA